MRAIWMQIFSFKQEGVDLQSLRELGIGFVSGDHVDILHRFR